MSDAPQDYTPRLLVIAPDDGRVAPLVERFGIPEWQRVASAAALRAALRHDPWDALIHVFGTASLTPQAALRLLQQQGFDLPFLIVATPDDEKAAIRVMKLGAHDVVSSDRLDRLVPAVEREIREARHRSEHRAALEMLDTSEARLRGLASSLPGMVFQLVREPSGPCRFQFVSEGCHKLIGIKPHELLSSARRFFDAFDADDRKRLDEALDVSASGGTLLNWHGKLKGRSKSKWIELRSTPHRNDDGVVTWQGIATNVTQSKEIEGELRRSREQLSELSFHLEAAKEEERERIARDIHDELGSILVRLKIEAALLASKLPAAAPGDRPGPREKAHSIEALLDQAMGTASRVARELRPGILKEFGLPAAIECQAEDFAQRSGITCRFQCDDEGMEADPDTSLALFRIAQEALTNIAKHARASLVVVRMRRENGSILLDIRDNGRGISEADMSKPKSFGLRGIRERVHSLAGEFSIGAGEHGGTHIALRVPERRNAEVPAAEEDAQRNLF